MTAINPVNIEVVQYGWGSSAGIACEITQTPDPSLKLVPVCFAVMVSGHTHRFVGPEATQFWEALMVENWIFTKPVDKEIEFS